MANLQTLDLKVIVLDPDIQPRAELDADTVAEYQEIYEEAKVAKTAAPLPPCRAFRIDGKFLLTRGFHRVTAAKAAGIKAIDVDIRTGTRDDACLDAMQDNRTHGRRYKHADLVKQVTWLLSHDPYKGWGQAKLAEISGISVRTVKYIVDELRSPAVPLQQGIVQTCTIKTGEPVSPAPEAPPEPAIVTPPGGSHPRTPGNPRGAGRKPKKKTTSSVEPEEPAEPITKSDATLAKEAIKRWMDTVGRWMPLIDGYRETYSGAKGDKVINAAKSLFNALTEWRKGIK